MKSKVILLIAAMALAVIWPASGQNQDATTIKNQVIQDTDASKRSSQSYSAAGASANYMYLGEECGMYLNENWLPGTIKLQDGTVFENRLIRYNIYNQQMEFTWLGDTSAIGNPEEIDKLTIDSNTFVYRQFVCKGKVRQGYLELLVEGKYELLLHRGIKYIHHEENPYGSVDGGPANTYYQGIRYFLSCNGRIAEELPEKKNAIISAIDGDQKELKKFVKEHKCKLKSQNELVDFFVYANTF